MRGRVGPSGRGLRDRRRKTAPRALNDGGARAGHTSPAPRAASVSACCALCVRDVRLQRARAPLSLPRFCMRGLQARNRRGVARRADAYHAR
jgi:hypothetical protein